MISAALHNSGATCLRGDACTVPEDQSMMLLAGQIDVLFGAEVFDYSAAGTSTCCPVGVLCRLSVKYPLAFDSNGAIFFLSSGRRGKTFVILFFRREPDHRCTSSVQVAVLAALDQHS